MIGSQIYGRKEAVSVILGHPLFKEIVTRGEFLRVLLRTFGHLYLRFFGWPNLELREIFPKVIRLLEPRPTDSILDLGCGPGVYSLEIASRWGCSITGADIDEVDIRFCTQIKELDGLENARFAVMDAAQLPLALESFDKVICIAVLEHIQDDDRAVREIARVLRRKGSLVAYVPYAPVKRQLKLKHYWWRKEGDRKGRGQVREGYSLADLDDLLGRNGLKLSRYFFGHTWLESRLHKVQKRTNAYLAFPLIYPVLFLLNPFFRRGSAILFKAVKTG